jgi:hypothetical protein
MKPVRTIILLGICAGALFAWHPATALALGHGKAAKRVVSHKKHRHHPKATDTFENERIKYTFQKIGIGSPKSKTAATDDWQASSKPTHHKKK